MLDDEELSLAVYNTCNLPSGLLLLEHLIEMSACSAMGCTFDLKKDYYNKGFQDFGRTISNLILNFAPQFYIKMIKEKQKSQEN